MELVLAKLMVNLSQARASDWMGEADMEKHFSEDPNDLGYAHDEYVDPEQEAWEPEEVGRV